MRSLAPYQFGLWLAEHINKRCQLCGFYPSISPIKPQTTNTLLAENLQRITPKGSLLCANCHDDIAWLPKPFRVDIGSIDTLIIQVATYYDYPIREAIRAFKHSEDMAKLPLLVHVLRQIPRPNSCHAGNSVIVAMPTTNSRLIKRGFDPVTILSAYLSKHWQIPLWQGVERNDDTLSQQGLTRSERLTNLNNAFVMTQPPPVKRLLLFDDVATTGASLQALAAAFYPNVSTPLSDRNIISVNSTTTTSSKPYQILGFALAHGSQSRQ